MSTQLKSIAVSLEMARKLKEAGWPQETSKLTYWSVDPEGNDAVVRSEMERHFIDAYWNSRGEACDDQFRFADAPTAEEILRRLLTCIGCGRYGDDFFCDYYNRKPDLPVLQHQEIADTLANAAAAMYCYLAKNGLLPKADEAA